MKSGVRGNLGRYDKIDYDNDNDNDNDDISEPHHSSPGQHPG